MKDYTAEVAALKEAEALAKKEKEERIINSVAKFCGYTMLVIFCVLLSYVLQETWEDFLESGSIIFYIGR